MTLQKFIDDFEIDLDALKHIKKRVFVVGRFNQRAKEDDTEIFLFTNRESLNDRYVKNFTGVSDMSYESFVQALQPAIAEVVEPKDQYNRFHKVKQVVPQGDEALEGSSIIDVFNYFFQRAVSNSEQEAFKGGQPGIPKDLLQGAKDKQSRGKAILSQIRKNLEIFCSFQPDTHQVIDILGDLLDKCGHEHDLPPFATGDPLPGGFPERLLDFVYAEDNRLKFDATGLDFSGPWEKLRKDDQAKETFCNIVSAFRDALLSVKVEQYNHIKFRGKPLSKLAQSTISGELKQRFQEAREAFNGLRQILRSKVLLSMILEWLLSAYYNVKQVDKIPANQRALRDEAVEDAILRNWKENNLAPPVRRPDREERWRFSKLLSERFEDVLEAIISSEEEVESKLTVLPKPLSALVNSIRQDKDKQKLLMAVAGAKLGEELHQAFIDASKTILLDVLCPNLFRNPILTTQMLKKYFRQESMAAYLTAVFLGDSTQDAVRKIADEHLEFFESKIDEKTKKLHDEDDILERLLSDFLDVLAQPEVQRRLGEGVRVLQEVHALLDSADSEKKTKGAGAISSSRQHDREEGTLEKTPVDQEMVEVAVKQRFEAKLEEKIGQIVNKMDGKGKSPKSADSKLSEKKATKDKNSKTEGNADEEDVFQSRLDRQIDEILNKKYFGVRFRGTFPIIREREKRAKRKTGR
jgi:hypothetical protein